MVHSLRRKLEVGFLQSNVIFAYFALELVFLIFRWPLAHDGDKWG